MMAVNDKRSLPGYSKATVKVASNLGGGVAGWGDLCGAIIGGTMAIGLLIGTNGEEPIPMFDEMRLKERKITLELIKAFEERWGNVGCRILLGCEGCTPEERAKRGEDLRERGESHCDEYVDWAVMKTLEIIRANVM